MDEKALEHLKQRVDLLERALAEMLVDLMNIKAHLAGVPTKKT